MNNSVPEEAVLEEESFRVSDLEAAAEAAVAAAVAAAAAFSASFFLLDVIAFNMVCTVGGDSSIRGLGATETGTLSSSAGEFDEAGTAGKETRQTLSDCHCRRYIGCFTSCCKIFVKLYLETNLYHIEM